MFFANHIANAASPQPTVPTYIANPKVPTICNGQVDLLYRSDQLIYALEWCESTRYIVSLEPQTGQLNWRFKVPDLPDEPGFGRNNYDIDGANEHGVVFYDSINGTPALLDADGQFIALTHFPHRERYNEPNGVSIFDGKQFIWSAAGSEVAKYDIATTKKTVVGELPVELLVQSTPYALVLYEDKLLIIRQLSSRLGGNHNIIVMNTGTGEIIKKKKYKSTAPRSIYYFKMGDGGHFINIYLNTGAEVVESI